MKPFPRSKRSADTETSDRIRLPLAVKIIYIVSIACIPIYLAFLLSESFSDFFNRYVSSVFRALLAHLTSWIPFSLAEFALILIPLWVFLITRLIVKHYGNTTKEFISGILCICSILGIVFSSFTLGFASAYRGTTLDKKLGLERCDVSAQELYDTALILADLVNEESANIAYGITENPSSP